MPFDAYIFDLDGTLLDTLPDLVNLTNTVLREQGMPERTTEEVNSFVGHGARVLLQRAADVDAEDAVVDLLLARWKELYPEYGHRLTHPYAGISEALDRLKAGGAKLGVLSNKFDAAVGDVIGSHFPGVFDLARGECQEIPRKPDPSGLQWMMASFRVEPQRCAYIGDSGSDMTVALSAGAFPIGVTWGYRSKYELKEHGARKLIDNPKELLEL